MSKYETYFTVFVIVSFIQLQDDSTLKSEISMQITSHFITFCFLLHFVHTSAVGQSEHVSQELCDLINV